jgi:hypothetical protein
LATGDWQSARLDAHAWGAVIFEAAGLIVAERDGRIVIRARGFGPERRWPPPTVPALPRAGTTLLIEPTDDPELVPSLLAAAEHYLRARGAKVVYARALFPLNPFYWGLYGGSEGSGVLSGHEPFHRALIDLGYEPVGSTVLLEADLSRPEPRDPRASLIRRQAQLEFREDAPPEHWWEGLALGEFSLTDVRLLTKSDGTARWRRLGTA